MGQSTCQLAGTEIRRDGGISVQIGGQDIGADRFENRGVRIPREARRPGFRHRGCRCFISKGKRRLALQGAAVAAGAASLRPSTQDNVAQAPGGSFAGEGERSADGTTECRVDVRRWNDQLKAWSPLPRC